MTGNFEPLTIDRFQWIGNYELAPGVEGMAYRLPDGLIYIPIVNAVREGSGDVGRFLDSLSQNCRIIGVVSLRLIKMLRRRGWVETDKERRQWERTE